MRVTWSYIFSFQDNVDTWLKDIGMHQYKHAFTKCHIREKKDLEQLKSFDRTDIETELSITKAGKFLYLERVFY